MMKKSVYQLEDYKQALKLAGERVVEIDKGFFAVERTLSFLGVKKIILEARGTPSSEELKKFKEASKKYFYGTIAPCVVEPNKGVFEKERYKKVENNTILIDLKKTEKEIWEALEKKSARWGVKTAERNGLVFDEANGGEVEEFYGMYLKTARTGGFKPEKKEFIESILKSEIAKMFVVKYNEKLVAGGIILVDKANNYAILDLTSASEQGLELQAMPFLYWKFVIYAKSRGLRYFDLGGYDKEAKKGDKTYNINKFKERFGGEVREQFIFSTNWKYALLRKLAKQIRFLKGVYRKE